MASESMAVVSDGDGPGSDKVIGHILHILMGGGYKEPDSRSQDLSL